MDGWKKQPLIHTTPRTRAQVIQSRTSWHSMIKQKKKSEPGGSLVKHLLDVTRKRKPATREVVTKQRGKKIKFLKFWNQHWFQKIYFYFFPLLHEYRGSDPRPGQRIRTNQLIRGSWLGSMSPAPTGSDLRCNGCFDIWETNLASSSSGGRKHVWSSPVMTPASHAGNPEFESRHVYNFHFFQFSRGTRFEPRHAPPISAPVVQW